VPQIKLLRPPSSSTADCHPTSQAASQTARQPSRERGLPDVRTARRSAAAEAGVRRRGTRRGTGRRERGERWVGGSLAGRGGGLRGLGRGWWALSTPPPVLHLALELALGRARVSSPVSSASAPARAQGGWTSRGARSSSCRGQRAAGRSGGPGCSSGVVDLLSAPLQLGLGRETSDWPLRLTTASTSVKKLQRL